MVAQSPILPSPGTPGRRVAVETEGRVRALPRVISYSSFADPRDPPARSSIPSSPCAADPTPGSAQHRRFP
jgi:hypothetical protein